jgi:phosphopentomutase
VQGNRTTGKVVLIVLDGVGIGELPDAQRYGDGGSNTIVNTARAVGGLKLPHLGALGLGNIEAIPGVPPAASPCAFFGKMAEVSRGKDSTTGHWELAGLIVEKEFPTYPSGFPYEVLDQFLRVSGTGGYLGNIPASGTAIIQELGDEHVRTGYPIIYTSADSVFQIASHEDVIPLPRLYEICRRTREQVCVGNHAVGRVIARPFVGGKGNYTRTTNRKDFSLDPFGPTVLDVLSGNGISTLGIGKIDDLFAQRGLTSSNHTRTNRAGLDAIIEAARGTLNGLIVANLGDFDTLYGHRNDPQGFARALEEFDAGLPKILETLSPKDLLLITADHGNDPVSPSTDHSREYVPLLCLAKVRGIGHSLGVRGTFADVGKTIADFFAVDNILQGTSFLAEVAGR